MQTESLNSDLAIPSSPLLSVGEGSWFAVQTRPRHEKKVADGLRARTIENFLPLNREIHRWTDRRKLVELPLFPSYVFVRMQSTHDRVRSAVLTTPGVLAFVGHGGLGAPIPDREIESVRHVAERATISPAPYLKAGQRLRIRGGCLDGVEGLLLSQDGEDKLIVSIELIQRSVSVLLSGYDVEAA